MFLTELPDDSRSTVRSVIPSSPDLGEADLRRLAELGFIAGEPLHLRGVRKVERPQEQAVSHKGRLLLHGCVPS